MDDLGLVDLKTMRIVRSQAGRRPDRAVDVDYGATTSANQVVMVIAHPILVKCGRSGGLDATYEVLLDQDAECVVHGLARDRPDDGPDVVGHLFGRGVRARGHSPHDGKPLCCHLHAMPPELLFDGTIHDAHTRTNYGFSPLLDAYHISARIILGVIVLGWAGS